MSYNRVWAMLLILALPFHAATAGWEVIKLPDGTVQEGPVVDDKKTGHWVMKWPDGRVEEIRF